MIKIIKLPNGVEVIGDIVHECSSHIIMKNPLQINYKYHLSSYPSASLSKYMMFADSDEISFDKSNIMNIVVPMDKFVLYYERVVELIKSEFDVTVDNELSNLLDFDKARTPHTSAKDMESKMLTAILESFETKGLKN